MDSSSEAHTAHAGQTLHNRIVSELEGKIVSGVWPPGFRVPTELELTREYSCSRMTVNKALSQLTRAGLIERRRGAGTIVVQPRVHAALLEIHEIQTEVEATGAAYRYELVRRQARIGTPAGQPWVDVTDKQRLLSLTCRHFAGSRPFCLEERLINLDAIPAAAEADFAATAPSTWLLRQVPWTAAEHRIRAGSADDATADLLAIPRDAACLVVERSTWHADQPVTNVRLTYPAGVQTLVARFTPTPSLL